jgi:hypothetical protein
MVTQAAQKIWVVILATLMLLTTSAGANLERALDQTINEVAQEAARKLNDTNFQDITNIAILPLWGDCSPETGAYIVNAIQSQIIGGRYKVMERDPQTWNTLLMEVGWGNRREDIMDAQTVQRFGKIVGCDAIVFGTVRECASYPDSSRAVTRLTLKMSMVQTGEAKWSSGEIKSVRILSVAEPSRPDMDPALIRAVARLTDGAAEGLKGRNIAMPSFGIFPLLGQDQSGYVTDVLQAKLTKAGCNPVPVSRTEWREYLEANSRDSASIDAMSDFARQRGAWRGMVGLAGHRWLSGQRSAGLGSGRHRGPADCLAGLHKAVQIGHAAEVKEKGAETWVSSPIVA